MHQNTAECFPAGFSFVPGESTFPLSTDTMALADFITLRKNARVADLGSGSGALGLLLLAKEPSAHITGIELHLPSHEAALNNIQTNSLQEKMISVFGDLRDIRHLLTANSFSCVVSNPPYYSTGARSRTHAAARQEETCTLKDIFAAAKWLLPTGGDLFLVHKAERLPDLMILARQHALEAKTLQPLCHKPGDAPSMVLLHCRRGGHPGLRFMPPIYLYDASGAYTQDYKRIYHIK